MYFLDLDGQTRVLLLDTLANRVVPRLVLPVLMSQHVISVLDGPPNHLIIGLGKVELHYGVIFELTFADEVKFALVFGEDGEAGEVLV